MSWFWTTTTNGHVRVLAAGFGLGPRIAAETLLDSLGLVWKPWRPAADFIAASQTRVVFNFGVREPRGADALASRRVWVDCLMWLRTRLPAAILEYDLALAEGFFETRSILRALGPEVVDIQPLIPRLPNPSRCPSRITDLVLVSFGGIETPFTRDAHRCGLPALVLESLAHAATERTKTPRIVCCAPPAVVASLRTLPRLRQIDWSSPTRSQFVEQLTQADRYIVQPGLYGPFEAFEAGIAATVTLPMSYTQVCQSLEFETHRLVASIPLFASMRETIGPLTFDIEEEQPHCFDKIAAWFETAQASANIQAELRAWAHGALDEENADRDYISARRQYAYTCRKLPRASDLVEIQRWLN